MRCGIINYPSPIALGKGEQTGNAWLLSNYGVLCYGYRFGVITSAPTYYKSTSTKLYSPQSREAWELANKQLILI